MTDLLKFKRFPTVFGAALALAGATFSGCGDDPAPATDTSDVAPPEDTTEDVAPPEDTTETDVADDIDESDTAEVCANPCLNDLGRNDRRLCPQPISEWECIAGCCEPVFRCATDDDCRAEGYTNGQCKDERYDCRCDVPSGACGAWYCKVDGDCTAGSFCVGGACIADPDGPLTLRAFGPEKVLLMTGFTYHFKVDGYRTSEAGPIARPVAATYGTADATVATVDATGVITAVGAGVTTITASLTGSTSVEIMVTVLPVDPSNAITMAVVTEGTYEPAGGTWVINDTNGVNLAFGDIDIAGIFEWEGPVDDIDYFDVHILVDDNDWITWASVPAGTVRMNVVPLSVYGRVSLDADMEFQDDTELQRVALVRGTPDLTLFEEVTELDAAGNIELVLTSGGLSSALFDFSLPALLGADVKRFFDPRNSIPRVNTAESISIPGGIVFNIATPAIPEFHLTAPKGPLKLWSLGGRLDINDLAEYSAGIFAAFTGSSLDFTQIVGAVFPLFRNFWSGYTESVSIEDTDNFGEVVAYDPSLTTPMTMTTRLTIPELPRIGTVGRADALFLLGGAQTPDGYMIPLGLNGGADTSDKTANPPDGFADSDERTPAIDPFPLPIAALHSGLQGPFARYLTVAVAVSIPTGSGDPRPSAGSAVLTRFAENTAPPAAQTVPDFLGFPEGSWWDPETLHVRWSPVAGADIQRVLLKGKKGEHWTVYGANGVTEVRLPHPADFDMRARRIELDNIESVLINSIDFEDGFDVDLIGGRNGVSMDMLLSVVKRVSFIDIKRVQAAP